MTKLPVMLTAQLPVALLCAWLLPMTCMARVYYALESKPSSLLIFDGQGNQDGTVALEREATNLLVDGAGRFAYVVETAKKAGAADDLAVIDLKSRSIVARIDVGVDAVNLVMSRDGQRLFCFSTGLLTAGDPVGKAAGLSAMKVMRGPRTSAKERSNEQSAVVTVIDAATGKVSATHRWEGHSARQMILAPDAQRLLLLSEGWAPSMKSMYGDQTAVLFRIGEPGTPTELDLEMNVSAFTFSANGATLFFAGSSQGKKTRGEGRFEVVDMAAGKIARKDEFEKTRLGMQMASLPDGRGFVLTDSDGVRLFDGSGAPIGEELPIGEKHAPGEMTLLPDGNHLAVLALDGQGQFAHKMAVLNLAEHKMEDTVEVGSSKSRRANATKGFLKQMGEAALAGAVAGAVNGGLNAVAGPPPLGVPPYVNNVNVPAVERNRSSQTALVGDKLWILDGASTDVTEFSIRDFKVPPKYTPVSSTVTSIIANDSGTKLFCVGEKHVDVIDLTGGSNTQSESKLTGTPVSIQTTRDGEILILKSSSLDVWDMNTGKEKFSATKVAHLKALAVSE